MLDDLNSMDEAVGKIAQLGVDATKLDVISASPPSDSKGLVPFAFMFNHQTGEAKGLRQLAEEWRVAPERKRGVAQVSTLASLIDLANRHKTDTSVLFAKTSWPGPSITAVLDYHGPNEPGFGQHRVHYPFPITDEFKAWMDQDGKAMTQHDFATFIENRIAEIANADQPEDQQYSQLFQTPFATAADMMMLSRGLEVHVSAAVKTQHTLQSGEKEIVFTEEHDTKITVPGLFMVHVPAFLDAEPVRLPARLRYRVNGGALTWFYQLYRWKELLRTAVVLDLERVVAETGMPSFEGAQEQG